MNTGTDGDQSTFRSSFTKRFSQLLDSVIDPAWARLLAMPWAVRATALVGIVGGLVVWQVPGAGSKLVTFVTTPTRPVAVEPEPAIHSDSAAQVRLRIAHMVRAEILSVDPKTQTAWSLAQAILPATMDESRQLPNLADIENQIEQTAHNKSCWSELNNEPQKPCALFISGWVMTALSKVGLEIDDAYIQSAIATQKPSGAWPMFEATISDKYSSTYTTTWMILGLTAARDASISTERASTINASIDRACSWLVQNRADEARWKPFPDLGYSQISPSISGLAVHAISAGCPNQFGSIARDWIDNLPKAKDIGSNDELGYVEIQTAMGDANDHFVYFRAPWMMIATIDAAKVLNTTRRQKAIQFINALVARPEVQQADRDHRSWARAELLLALEYLADNSIKP